MRQPQFPLESQPHKQLSGMRHMLNGDPRTSWGPWEGLGGHRGCGIGAWAVWLGVCAEPVLREQGPRTRWLERIS